MSAIGDLFLNPGGGGTPPSESSGSERSLPGTIYFAWKPELDASNHAFSVANQQRAKHGLIAKASPDVFHATICPVGYSHLILDERIQAALKAAEAVMAKPFEVVFDRVRTYQNGQEKAPFVAYSADGLPKAELFRAALVAELRRAGFTFKKKLPDPHMTLLYDRIVVGQQEIDPIRWMVRDFVLIQSVYGQGRHIELGRWPLRG